MEKWKARFGSIAIRGSAYQYPFGPNSRQTSNGFELDSRPRSVCDQRVHTLPPSPNPYSQPNYDLVKDFYSAQTTFTQLGVENERQNSKLQGARHMYGDGQWALG